MKICFNITSKCNKECSYCFRSMNENDLSLEQIKDILYKLKECNVTNITWSGGEFFLYKNYIEVLKLTKEIGFYCSVATNGLLLTDDKIKEFLPYVDKLNLSLDFLDDDLNEEHSRGRGYLNIFTNLITKVKKIKPSILIKVTTIVLKQNYHSLEKFYETLLPLSINIWKIVNYCAIRNSTDDKAKLFKVSDKEFSKVAETYLNRVQNFIVVVEDDKVFQHQYIISPSGKLCISKDDKEVVLVNDIHKENLSTLKKQLCINEKNQLLDNINLNTYKMFFEVAVDGNITRVAERNFVAQSAISRAIRILEETIQSKLFTRRKNGMFLTQKGMELFYYVSKIMDLFKLANLKMFDEDGLTMGRLNIGVPSHIANFFIFNKVREFHKTFPFIDINIISRSSKELFSKLQLNEVDFLIDTSPLSPNNVENLVVEGLIDVRHCFFAKNNSNYKNSTSLKELENQPLILPVLHSSPRKDLDIIINSNNLTLRNVVSIETSEMIINAVKENMGIGYVLYDLVKTEIENQTLKEIFVKETLPSVSINLIYKKDMLTTVAKNFINNYLKKDLK